jgi:predicted small lipoprotein YifL
LLPLEFPPDKVVGIEEEVEGEDEDEVDADFDDESAD